MSAFGSDPKRRALLDLLLREEGLEPLFTPKIDRRKDADCVPLSSTQQQMWYLDQLEPGNPSYTISIVLRFKGPLNVMALEKSFNEIVRRHESLRTTFAAAEANPIQRIAPALTVTLPVVDLVTIPETERSAQVMELVIEEVRRSFDLITGPLLRFKLLRVGMQEYVLVIGCHHIIMDGLSTEVFFRETAALYEAFSMGRPSPLVELPLQYADFVHWQRERLQGEVLEQHLSYWKKQLDRAPAMLELPTDRPRPTVQTFAGASQSVTLSKSLTEQLRALSRREGVTLFMTMLAAFQVLLSRITGEEDIVVGSPIAGRSRPEVEELIGLFINTLVLRTNLSDAPSFRELLRRVRDVVLGAFAHQEVPFEKLMGELDITRSLSHNTLFQVMLNFRQQKKEENLRLPELTAEEFPFRKGVAKFDLTLAIVERPDSLYCSFKYNTDLFDATTILRLLGNFQVLLEGIIANPDQRLSGLSLLTSAERQQLMLEWNDTNRDYLLDECIAVLFEKQTDRTPDSIAVIFEERQLTYRQLNNAANRLASVLSQKGIGKGCYVPILMERSIEVPLAMLAIMKSGAAFVPLDIHWPIGRLKHALEELGSEVILVNNTTSFLEEQLGRCFVIVSESQSNAPAANPQIATDPQQPIYAIYTSGSTGVPKAVVVPHRGITNRFLWMNEFFGREAAASVLQTTPHLYDSAVWQFFWPLINGGKTVIPSPGMELDADYLSSLIHRRSITMTDFVPSVFNTIVPQLTDGALRERLGSLRCVIVGGEEITPRTTYTFMEHYPKVRVVNLYGPTEASIGCICYEVTGKKGGKIPIGKPISNVYVLILDRNMKPVPIGVPGELYLSGICLGVGYLNDEEKTNAAFLDNPFPEIDHTKIYKTGDRARYLPDGNVEFLGRMDNQVKLRGFRIELREIEAVLSQHPAVQQAAVVVREDSPGDKHLVAYVVVKQGSVCTATEIRNFLKTKLPNYMIPSSILFLDVLPLTANGKLDRRALPPPDQNRPELDCGYVPPRTALEKSVAKIWAEILNVDQVGIHDNFFALGGHSLLTVRLLAEIEKVFKTRPPLASLFQEGTIEQLASLISQRSSSGTASRIIPIQPKGDRLPFFCVHELFGNVLCYTNLARHLGPDQPFYAIEARGLDGAEEPFFDIEAMSAYYIDQMREVQPHGPYALGGLCFGGVVAFEMARQLRAKGESVRLVALLDSGIKSGESQASGWRVFKSISTAIPSWLAGALQLNGSQWLDLVKLKRRQLKAKLAHTLGRLNGDARQPHNTKLINEMADLFGFSEQHRKIAYAQHQAIRKYIPRSYPGRLTLFRAQMQPLFSSHRADKGWRRFAAGGLDVRVVPGNHLGMLQEPHVKILAKELRACLD